MEDGTEKHDDNGQEQYEHPKGALTFMVIYLVFITLIWLNAYLRLWLKG
jgi:hypothetical protein